jgi:hypothetical protein
MDDVTCSTCTREISPWHIHHITVQFKAKSCLQSKQQNSVHKARVWIWLGLRNAGKRRHLQPPGPEPRQTRSKMVEKGILSSHHLSLKLIFV